MVRKDFCTEVKEYIAVIELGLPCLYQNIDFPLYPSILLQSFCLFFFFFFFLREEGEENAALELWNPIFGIPLFLVIEIHRRGAWPQSCFVNLSTRSTQYLQRTHEELECRDTPRSLQLIPKWGSEASFGFHVLV